MSAVTSQCKKIFTPLLHAQSRREQWIYIFLFLLQFGLYFYILFSALGKAPRNIGSITALVGLVGYYALDYKNSNLNRLGSLKWIYFIFLAYLFFKVFHNIQISNGWYGFKNNAYQGFALFFIGLESIRTDKDLKRLLIFFCIAGFYQGLDGIYQWITGVDFFHGTTAHHWQESVRLTGSMKTYRVGNYLSMILPLCLGAWWLLPSHWSKLPRLLVMIFLLLPPVFLLIGSQTRSGMLGAFVAIAALILLYRGFSWKQVFLASGVTIWALFWGFKRTAWETLKDDPRIVEIWPHAIQIFKSAPLLGVGLNSFNPGMQSLGLEFVKEPAYLQHPHNVYLQFLCEMGLVGLIILLMFYGSYLFWSLKKIQQGMKNKELHTTWAMTACFWASFLGYMVTAFSGHDFFRNWWLGLALCILGILMGNCLFFAHNHPR